MYDRPTHAARPVNSSAPHRTRGRRGQSMVEFALVVPIFLTLLFGTLEVGMLFKTRSAYQVAALQAVRVAAAAGNDANADQYALNQLQATLPVEDLTRIVRIMIFRAGPDGSFLGPIITASPETKPSDVGCPSTTPPSVATPCDNMHTYYVYKKALNRFVCAGAGELPSSGCGASESYWDPRARSTKVGSLDYIGIEIDYDYRGATGILPVLHLSQNATTTIEPTGF